MPRTDTRIRYATMEDCDTLREQIRFTLLKPDGKGKRTRYEEAVQRQELLVFEALDPRDKQWHLLGFIEWHMRVDGTVTIRDMGTTGDAPQTGVLKALVRELISLLSPEEVTVKVRQDQPVWNSIFMDLPGFRLDGTEYSRPYYRNVWVWSRRR